MKKFWLMKNFYPKTRKTLKMTTKKRLKKNSVMCLLLKPLKKKLKWKTKIQSNKTKPPIWSGLLKSTII
jgi:hypothetical protein